MFMVEPLGDRNGPALGRFERDEGLHCKDVLDGVFVGAFRQITTVPAIESFAFFRKLQLPQVDLIAIYQSIRSPELASHIQKFLSFFVSLFFKHRMSQKQGLPFNRVIFLFRLDDVLIDDEQFLFQCGNNQMLATIMLGCSCEVFCMLLRVRIGFFPPSVSPHATA